MTRTGKPYKYRLCSVLALVWIPLSTACSRVNASEPTKFDVLNSENGAVRYDLSYVATGEPHLDIKVSIEIKGDPGRIEVQMPTWSPGDYHLQNHAKQLRDLKAFEVSETGTEQAVPTAQTDANTWTINGSKQGKYAIHYTMYETPPGIFSENIKLNTHFGFVNGPAALIYLVDHKTSPCRLFLHLPAAWTGTLPLEPILATAADPVGYKATDYDALADSPEVFGDAEGLKITTFKQDNADFSLVLFRKPSAVRAADELLSVAKTIAHTESSLMGGMPSGHYAFLFDIDGPGGGLEHLNSFRIGLFSRVSPARFSSMIGHEFFHQWNIKRIRPESLGPFDYITPPRTHNLWFAEGVTEYYAQISCLRAGFTTPDALLTHYRRMLAAIPSMDAWRKVTAEDASYKVWESGDSQGYGGLSYYFKGELIGLCLDLKIRAVTKGQKSLDDVLRLLYKRHVQPQPGYGEDEIRTTVNEVAGQDLSDLYNTLVQSTADLPMAELLAPFGLSSEMQLLNSANAEPDAQRLLRRGWLEDLKQ